MFHPPNCEPRRRAPLPEGGWRERTRGTLTVAKLAGAPGLSGAFT